MSLQKSALQAKYPWGFNPIKLQQSLDAVTRRSKIDSEVKIDEKTIKAEYIARKGLLTDEAEEERILPRVTTNRKVKVSSNKSDINVIPKK